MRLTHIAFAACVFTFSVLRAQQPAQGIILGQVLDSVGVSRPDVEVRLAAAGGAIRTTVTDRDGVYIFRDLPLGVYRIEISDASYSSARAELTSNQPNAMVELTPRVVAYAKKSARKKAAPPRAAPSPMPPPPPPPPPSPPAAPVTVVNNLALKTVYFATDRAPSGSRIVPASYFSSDKNPRAQLTYGTCDVNIPIDHKFGQLETPDIFKLEFSPDPKKHFFVKSIDVAERDPFYLKLRAAVEKSPQKQAFVFVHGYNVTFESAALRTAQIAVDLKYDGAPVFYSWPSRGRLSGYLDDEVSVQWTVDHLRQFLQEVSERSGANKVQLIAHSMGSRALTKALQALGSEPAASHIRFQELILAAPDLDVEDFRRMQAAIGSSAAHVTLYASSRDKALIASDMVHFLRRRLGQAGSSLFVEPQILDTIDASAVDTDFLDHSYFADKSILNDVVQLVMGAKPPTERPGLLARQSAQGTYWQYAPR
jgi:esterase/lipase superfamily enzyme